jgi:hypothetical protein
MYRRPNRMLWLTSLLLFVSARPAVALSPDEGQGTYLGILFGPIAAALYDKVPQLPRQQGVLITQVLPESPAATADLRRHDILLTYDGHKVRDCEHLARLIRDDKPGRKLKLTYLRAGHEATAVVQLARGPALKLAGTPAGAAEARAMNKPGSPASVSATVTTLDNGRLKVTIEYIPEGSTRQRAVTWEGDTADLDDAARTLPERERQLARHALDRFRTLKASKVPSDIRPPS